MIYKGETADFVLPGFFGFLLDFSGFGIPKIRRFRLACTRFFAEEKQK